MWMWLSIGVVFNIRDKLGIHTPLKDKNRTRQETEITKLQAHKGQLATSRHNGCKESWDAGCAKGRIWLQVRQMLTWRKAASASLDLLICHKSYKSRVFMLATDWILTSFRQSQSVSCKVQQNILLAGQNLESPRWWLLFWNQSFRDFLRRSLLDYINWTWWGSWKTSSIK